MVRAAWGRKQPAPLTGNKDRSKGLVVLTYAGPAENSFYHHSLAFYTKCRMPVGRGLIVVIMRLGELESPSFDNSQANNIYGSV